MGRGHPTETLAPGDLEQGPVANLAGSLLEVRAWLHGGFGHVNRAAERFTEPPHESRVSLGITAAQPVVHVAHGDPPLPSIERGQRMQ
jgi:hypothetical protein